MSQFPSSQPAGGSSGRDLLLAAARVELAEHGHAGISLRAVTRRAGLSHASPKAHFGDRSGLLTAIATEGFRALSHALETTENAPGTGLDELGQTYVGFGLQEPALFDLMFRPSELHMDDTDLIAAQATAIGALRRSVTRLLGPQEGIGGAEDAAGDLALVSWAFVQGLLTLTRDGALGAALGLPQAEAQTVALGLVKTFTHALTPGRTPS